MSYSEKTLNLARTRDDKRLVFTRRGLCVEEKGEYHFGRGELAMSCDGY